METSSMAVGQLAQALSAAREASRIIDNLIAEHEYQDVASLTVKAAAELLQATTHMMQSQSDMALSAMDAADELMDAVFTIIDGEVEED